MSRDESMNTRKWSAYTRRATFINPQVAAFSIKFARFGQIEFYNLRRMHWTSGMSDEIRTVDKVQPSTANI